jgi:hypothetical protein
MAFLRPTNLRNLLHGESDCATRTRFSDTEDIARPSRAAERDAKRIIRSQRSLQHVPLDVEIARARVGDRFPQQHMWLR